MRKVSAVVIREHGEPREVVRAEELEIGEPGAGEALSATRETF